MKKNEEIGDSDLLRGVLNVINNLYAIRYKEKAVKLTISYFTCGVQHEGEIPWSNVVLVLSCVDRKSVV